MSGQTASGSGSRLNFGKEQKNMKNRIRVTEAEYQNRKTGEKATGCSVLILGEIKGVLEQL